MNLRRPVRSEVTRRAETRQVTYLAIEGPPGSGVTELALRLGVGFESAFLTQNTRADSISSSASTVTIAGVAGADLEWMFSNHFGIHAELMGRVGTAAEGWSVKSWTGYNRDALPGELYYAEIKQAPVSFSVGLVYMVTDP